MDRQDLRRFENLTYDDFRRLAAAPNSSRHERVGFPNAYREGKEEAIFIDILTKLANLNHGTKRVVLDIGPGCSDLPRLLIEHCRRHEHTLLQADSVEMLDQLPDDPCILKFPCYYPDCPELFQRFEGRIDAILTYSVLHYVFSQGNLFDFFDKTLRLLADGGAWLIGDIPNVSKRRRFFASPTGIAFHQGFTGSMEVPEVAFNRVEEGKIDDGVLTGLLLRARAAGFDAYLLPQAVELPMANRREDLLISKP